MIKIEVTFQGPTSTLKQHQLAEAARRTLKYLAETGYTEYVTNVDATVIEEKGDSSVKSRFNEGREP
jgi:hypothetical protein